MNKFFTAQRLKDTAYVTVGAFILAISINAVLLPNKLVAGGANGISIVINYVFGISPAIVLYAINIPLLVLCFLLLGKEVGVKTIYGSLIYPFFVGITSGMPVLTHNIFLAALFGGIITGAGLGLVFRGNASTGGTAIISQIVNKYFKVSLGIAILFVDGLVILSAMYAFNADIVLFSLICLFTIGRVVDMIQVGLVRSKNVMIISPKYVAIQERLLRELDKGVTSGALISFSLESAEAVKQFGETAKANGGNCYRVDMGIPEEQMYGLEVQDLDGNSLEPVWMKM